MKIVSGSNAPSGTTPTRNLEKRSSNWMLPTLAGAGAGIISGIGVHKLAGMTASRSPLWGLAAGGIAAIITGATVALIGREVAKLPPQPSTATAPPLPKPETVSPLANGMLSAGTRVGETYESDWECTTDSDGNQTCSWETDYDQIKTIEAIGNRDGYGSIADALRATTQGTNVIVRQENGRFRPYLVESDVESYPDRVQEVDRDIVAFMTDEEQQHSVRRGDELELADPKKSVNRPAPVGPEPRDSVAQLAFRDRPDSSIVSQGQVTDPKGLPTLEAALGEAHIRPGAHGVVKDADRFHVVRLASIRDPDKGALLGVLTTKDSQSMQAIEYRDQTLVPNSRYWVAPK